MSQETKNYQYERNDFNTYGVRGKGATVFITPTENDNGKVLGVSGGNWALVTPLTATQVGSEVALV